MITEEPKKFKPTDAELDILKVLWNDGPSTVREVQSSLPEMPVRGYTTVLKLLQIMTKKELVKRDTENRAHVYRAGHSLEETRKIILNQLLERYFNGSVNELVKQALMSQPENNMSLEELRRYVKQ